MRKVNEKVNQVFQFFGSYDESIKMPNKGWMNFPYKIHKKNLVSQN